MKDETKKPVKPVKPVTYEAREEKINIPENESEVIYQVNKNK